MAARLSARMERSERYAVPLANVIQLRDEETQSEVFLLGTLPHASGSQAASLINAIRPELVLADDTEVLTRPSAFTTAAGLSASNASLQVLDARQVANRVSTAQEPFSAATVALRAARDNRLPAAVFHPDDPNCIPQPALRAAMQRCLQLPPHLVPYDPVIAAVLHGERSVGIAQRLREASQRFKRVVCVLGLEYLPFIHTLWNSKAASAQVAYNRLPQLAEPVAVRPSGDTLISRLLPKAEEVPAAVRHHELAWKVTDAPMTQQAVLHWLRRCAGQRNSPLMRRRLLPAGQAVMEWSEHPEADQFFEEVDRLRHMMDVGPDVYEPQFIQAAWVNVAHVFANSILLGAKRHPLDYPVVKDLLVVAE
eukprot:GGOE01036408.1.p1 GENE.GGOE01036408.1~~GGOE01036408.1.p1  ORF type:complete len:427 (+),score=103.93 GGOE01036408.1:184-1281(+)